MLGAWNGHKPSTFSDSRHLIAPGRQSALPSKSGDPSWAPAVPNAVWGLEQVPELPGASVSSRTKLTLDLRLGSLPFKNEIYSSKAQERKSKKETPPPITAGPRHTREQRTTPGWERGRGDTASSSRISGRNGNGAAAVGNRQAVSQGVKRRVTNSGASIHPRERKTCPHSTPKCARRHSCQRAETTHVSVGNSETEKQSGAYKMEQYSAMQREKELVHVTTWVKHEDIMLSERNQVSKATCHVISFL